MYRLLLLLSLITGISSLINCRTACTECRFRRLTPEALQVHCTMCKECKQKLRERMPQLRRQQSQSPQYQSSQYQSPQYQSPQYQSPQYQYHQTQYQYPTPPICQDQCPTPSLCPETKTITTERTTNDAYDIYPAGCPTPPPCLVCPPGCVPIAPPPVRRMDDYEEMPLFDLGNIVVGLPNHIAVDNNQLK